MRDSALSITAVDRSNPSITLRATQSYREVVKRRGEIGKEGRMGRERERGKKAIEWNAYLDVSDQIVPEGWPTEVQRFEVGRLPSAERAEGALQGIFERFPKVAIKVRVYQWIQRWICVSDPEEDRDHDVGARTGLAAHRRNDVPDNSTGLTFIRLCW